MRYADDEKPCRDCGAVKPLGQFYDNPHGRKGKHPYCILCTITRSRRAEERRKAKRKTRAPYSAPRGTRARLMREQDGCCAICGVRPERTLHIDHDHDTGVVRALLCSGCNTGIGLLGECPERLDAAASYLRFHRSEAV